MYNYEIYKIIKVFDSEDLNTVNKLIGRTTTPDWVDGNVSFRGEEGVKNNLELKNNFYLNKIEKITFDALSNNSQYANFTYPKNVEGIIVSKTESGGYYNTHTDTGNVGHFSTTIFLSEKDSYEGGELSLWINGKEEYVKLNPGYAVVYPTGIPHRVNKVKSGSRIAIVFWTKSILKDPVILETCRELRSIAIDEKDAYVPNDEKMQEVLNQWQFKVSNAVNRLVRTYGDI